MYRQTVVMKYIYIFFFGDPTGFCQLGLELGLWLFLGCFFSLLTHRDATVAKLNLHFGQCTLSLG